MLSDKWFILFLSVAAVNSGPRNGLLGVLGSLRERRSLARGISYECVARLLRTFGGLLHFDIQLVLNVIRTVEYVSIAGYKCVEVVAPSSEIICVC